MALLEFVSLSKHFGDCIANKNISFSVDKGHIHGLIGENGAGKSTLMKMLFGLEKPTSGEIRLRGQAVHFASPIDAKAAGIGMVHQHFMQAQQMTALEHFALEHAENKNWKNYFFPIRWNALRARLEKLAADTRMPVPWNDRIEDLSIGFQQRIEILKLLDQGAEILIFDEPTAVLSPLEIAEFLERLRMLKAQGKTILLITHKLNEIKAVCDTGTVIRRGESIWSGRISETSETQLAELMVGQKFERTRATPCRNAKKPLLKVENLSVANKKGGKLALREIRLQVNTHEIVGVAGVEGNGQSELAQALLNPRSLKIEPGSTISLHNQALVSDHQVATNQNIRAKGVAVIAEDRLANAAVPAMTVTENFLLGRQDRYPVLTPWKQISQEASHAAEDFDVRPRDVHETFSSLSGGNQQKVVVGREITSEPQLLVAVHPTRGVDLLAVDRIHRKLIELRDKGCGILLVSCDLDELFRLSDRILVFSDGQIKAEFSKDNFNESNIGAAMGGLVGAHS